MQVLISGFRDIGKAICLVIAAAFFTINCGNSAQNNTEIASSVADSAPDDTEESRTISGIAPTSTDGSLTVILLEPRTSQGFSAPD